MTLFKKDRFDLEQAIMNAWATSEDLDLVYHNTDNLNLTSKDADTIQNQMLGLKYLFELRMEKVWSIFEDMIKDEQFKSLNDDVSSDENDWAVFKDWKKQQELF
tara:strand:- start:55 stop:366 length:312 start_codon:yes stop_codon:yes gene_type:complete